MTARKIRITGWPAVLLVVALFVAPWLVGWAWLLSALVGWAR